MSHVVTMKTQIGDLDALREACKALGLTFHENQTTYRWYGRWVNDYHAEDAAYHHGVKPEDYGKCSHAISAPGATYDIGVCKLANGNYTLIYDNFSQGMGLERELGPRCRKLKQEYGVQAAISQAEQQGLGWTKELDEDTGTVNIAVIQQ
jgi:hypothetical protein